MLKQNAYVRALSKRVDETQKKGWADDGFLRARGQGAGKCERSVYGSSIIACCNRHK
jgi:hypothetical protein